MEDKFKRKPAIECSLDQLGIDSTARIAVICNVISLNEELLEGIVSDGTREARIFFKDAEALDECKKKSIVRLVGKPLVSSQGIQLNVEFVQDIEGIDLQAYRKLLALEKKLFSKQ